jgi:hypothetical protein
VVVGQAEIDIVAIAPGFDESLKDQTNPGLEGFRRDAETAGEDAGAGLRTGVRDEARGLADDLGEVGASSGLALRDGVRDGTQGLQDDLAQAGAAGGLGLRSGVKEHTDGLQDDLGRAGEASGSAYSRALDAELEARLGELDDDGEKAGGRLAKGMGKGLEKLGDLAANTGLPVGGLSGKLNEAGQSLQDADHKSTSLNESLEHLGGVALLGVAGAAAVVGVVGVHLAEGMQTADASIAGAEGTSTSFARSVGDGFLDMAGKSEFSGETIAKAFAEVAGELKSTEGHALSTGESYKFMSAAGALAEAKQIQIGEATSATAKTLQAFGLDADKSAHVTDVLYQASNATGKSVEGLATQLTKVRSKLGETSGSVGSLAGLLVDMTDHGITGRSAMTGLNTGLNTLLKTSDGVATAVSEQNAAYDALSPALKALARQYQDGAISSEAFKKETAGLPPEQEQAVTAFTKASTAVQDAQAKYREMGLTVFDAQGKFVGMGSIIDQLQPRFEKMTQQQQLATAATLFGAGAARQMTAIIQAGPAAYDQATKSVEKHGAAESAASKQAETLHGEEHILGAEAVDLGTKIGEVLIPIVTSMVHEFVTATTFVLAHKEILVALGALIAGPLTAAITAFTVGKLEAFGQSWLKVGGVVKDFAGTVAGTVSKVAAEFRVQEAATGELVLTTETADKEMVAAADETAAGVDAALGATGVGLVLVGLGVAAGELEAHWSEAMHGMEKVGEAVANAIINELNDIIRAYNETIGELTGSVSEIEKVGAESKAGKFEAQASGAQSQVEKETHEAALRHSPDVAEGKPGSATVGMSKAELEALWVKEGGPKSDAETAAAIGLTESGGKSIPNSEGSGAEGIMQIKGADSPGNLENPEVNMRNAVEKFKGAGDSFSPWQTYDEGTYKANLGSGATAKNTAALEGLTDALKPIKEIPSGGASTPSGAPTGGSAAAETDERLTEKELKAEEAAKKAALEKEVKAQEKASQEWVSRMLAEETKVGAVRRAAIAQEVTEHKSMVAQIIADEKTGMSRKEATEKAMAAQDAKNQEAGEKERTKLETALTSGSLKELNTDLDKTHAGMLMELEGKLQSTHKAALEKLDSELVKLWQEAEVRKAALEKTEHEEEATKTREADEKTAKEDHEAAEKAAGEQVKAAEEAEKAKVDAINRQSAIETDKVNGQAQEITDATKVMLDKQAEVGLSGTAEIAAHLQTVADEVQAEQDKAINAAKLAQDETAGKGTVAEAEAAARTTRVEAEAKVKEAEAQRQLELAKAIGTTAASAAGAQPVVFNVVINGTGLSAADVMNEFAWNIKTGALPVAAPA